MGMTTTTQLTNATAALRAWRLSTELELAAARIAAAGARIARAAGK